MNENIQNLKGKIDEGRGKVIGSTKLKAKGKLEQTTAKVRKSVKSKI